ncbi:MAG: phosphoribosylglycinamide formyltransferase [Deltaproteobacteria bacterium]|nr:phosphoribosylglycinamide formyltransferase [Deltaproteobacteria bacterium]
MTAVLSTPLLGRAPCVPDRPLRVGVLVSGSGTNLQALLDAAARPRSVFSVVVVVSNVDGVRAIDRARAAGVPAVVEPHKGKERGAHEERVHAALVAAEVELVVLAGYMRVLTPALLDRWRRRVVNVHPALLPAFPGMHGAKQALDHGCRVAGCTVHLVDAGVDTGPILAQAAVPVLDHDDEAALQARIQREEHRLLPAVVMAYARGLVVDEGGRVRVLGVA